MAEESAPAEINVVDPHQIDEWLHHATHVLPTQGPIRVFVHHNTLHPFEDRSFDAGVLEGLRVYGSQPFWTEERFRNELARGRIQSEDIEDVLLKDLGDDSDRMVAMFGTRYELRLAMMKSPLRTLPDRELAWLLTEGQALEEFMPEIEPEVIRSTTESTRSFVLGLGNRESEVSQQHEVLKRLLDSTSMSKLKSWSEKRWRSFTLEYLWAICKVGVQRVHGNDLESMQSASEDPWQSRRQHRVEQLVNQFLIPFCAAYLDQGFATWQLPHREEGFLASFFHLYANQFAPKHAWLTDLPNEILNVRNENLSNHELVIRELARLENSPCNYEAHIQRTLLSLRGWAGMIWQMETAAPWTPKPAKSGDLLGYLAVRLMLERLARNSVTRRTQRTSVGDSMPGMKSRSIDSKAFSVFQIAQFRGWTPHEMASMESREWKELLKEIDSFHSLERRRIFQLAYERNYRVRALDAIALHSQRVSDKEPITSIHRIAKFQVITCIDEREESFRRHLEEVEPQCETFGAAGFFAVVMYYRGAAEAHFRPLCPINIVPKHFVCEEPVFSAESENSKRTKRRRILGKVTHRLHSSSRTIVGGLITGLFGSLATFPLVARVLAPHITARIRDMFSGLVRPPATELHLERAAADPGPDFDALGYTVQEMAGIVVRILQDIGLVNHFSPIVLFLGHGSSSLNNPHESAYNCGACSGGRGGPNARAFACMANDPRVRELVEKAGIHIPNNVWFVGGYHNTCNDRVEYFDLDRLPWQHRTLFREVEASIDEARARNAQERVRRFESARLGLSPSEALRHVEERSEDLSQARPEYNHATNALCLVGQRDWSRGLFMDRRAFLASYDPSIDDETGKIVERILQAAIPVCGGISLEYYFSTVDSEGYGCGSKLPHNIASLAGVMTGAASDLRPGLSAQMVEIHEPIRILFVVQTTPSIMHRIISANAPIRTLVEGEWVQLALFDSDSSSIKLYQKGEFIPYDLTSKDLRIVQHSRDMYRSERGHLPFATVLASIDLDSKLANAAEVGP